MSSEDLDFLPEYVRSWAAEHGDLLELIAEELLASGKWPSIDALTRRLARAGSPTPLRDLLWHIPRPLGFVDTPDAAVLHTYGLRLTEAGLPLLDGFIAALRLAVDRYEAEEESEPVIGRADVDTFVRANVAPRIPSVDAYMQALSDLLLREAPFLQPRTGAADDDWTCVVDASVVRYWDAETPDDFLRLRAGELRQSPHFGWPPEKPAAAIEITPTPTEADGDVSTLPSADQGAKDAFISHAGEDKETVAEPLAEALTAAGWHVWLDKLELTVGDSLNRRINDALARSRFGVVILSEAFFSKQWPQRELDALTARETISGQKVILPVWHRVDAAYLAEVSPTLADRVGVSTDRGIEHVAKELHRALEQARTAPYDPNRKEPVVVSVNRVPRTTEEQRELLGTRPPLWEYLLFASGLLVGKEALEVKWRDHELRIGRGPREHFDDVPAALRYLSHATNDMSHAVDPINRVFTREVQVEAFGASGESGDPARIEHMAQAVVRAYEGLLDTAAALRQQAVPASVEQAFELAAQLADNSVQEIREFIDRTVAETDRVPAYLADADPDKPMLEIRLDLTLSVDEDVQVRFQAELDRVGREAD